MVEKDKRSAVERIRALGFNSYSDRHQWLVEHQEEIRVYRETHTRIQTQKQYHIGSGTLEDILKHRIDKRTGQVKKDTGRHWDTPKPTSFTAAEFAEAILAGYSKMSCDIIILEGENRNLKARNAYLEAQAKLKEEQDKKDFSEKASKILGTFGE